MDDILLLEAVERYLNNEMNSTERDYFEGLRQSSPEIDQLVVEHSMFLHQIDAYSNNLNLKHQLHAVHQKLVQQGNLYEGGELTTQGKLVRMWQRYKKVTAIAASVGGAIALVISALVAYYAPVNQQAYRELNRKVEQISANQQAYGRKINEVESKIPKGAEVKGGGTGFLIDAQGYLVTNAHVLKGNSAIVVNASGVELKADIVGIDRERDIAILKITDKDFKAFNYLPYSISRTIANLGEDIYTLGYPRNDIVYNQGYLSARSGYRGDTLSYQLAIQVSGGNSGGPVLNKRGEVIGIIRANETNAPSVVFAIKSKHIFYLVDELKKKNEKIKVSNNNRLRGVDKESQLKQVEECVFMVKAY
jgi:serine protease Do